MFRRPLIPFTALLWGLQFSFLSPALALILVSLYHATPVEVGWVLAIYNAAGFVAALWIPARADRRGEYLPSLLVAAGMTVALAAALALATSLPLAVVALVVFGAPAGVGSSLLFAHLRATGAGPRDVINTRAVFSFAWVAGPPVATALMGWFGNASVLPAIGVIAVANVVTTVAMNVKAKRTARAEPDPETAAAAPRTSGVARGRVAVIVVAFVLAQATNAAAVAVMTLFVTEALRLPVWWAGIALGAAAALEIPALMSLGRLSTRFPLTGLMVVGCVAGVAYYAGMVLVTEPIALIALQALNAIFFAAVAGVGLTLFQELIPGPGMATGLNTNTRRIGTIVAGPIIGLAAGPWGYHGVYVACAALTVVAGVAIGLAGRRPGASGPAA